MNCADCRYFDASKKKEGAISGCYYYCSKKKCFISGANNICENFVRTYARKQYEINEIYEEGKKFYDNTTPLWFYVTVLIILIILGLLLGVFF